MGNEISSFSGDFRFLSNFSHSPITVDGKEYLTVEHAYQAAKTADPIEKQQVANCATPGKAKRMGRTITLRAEWDDVKADVMESLLILKFSIPEFKEKLIATWPKILIERNKWHDNYWGNCECECSDCATPGQNILGNLLMRVRSIP